MSEQIQESKTLHEIDLIEIISVLWRAKKFIGSITLISFAIGVLYIIFATKMYSGTITLYPAQQSASNPMTAMARQIGMSGASVGDANYNIPDVVKSRTLSEKIVTHKWDIKGFDKKVDLIEYFDSIWKVKRPEWVSNKETEKLWQQTKTYSYSQHIASRRISANVNSKTGLIKISVQMENAKLATDIANFISIFLTDWVNNNQKESIRKNLEFINERASLLGAELKEAENELKKFRETNRNILNSPDLQLELQRLQRQVTIKQEVYLTMIKQREINQIEENKSSDVIRILDKAIVNNSPSKPNKKLTIMVTVFLGLLFSIIVTIIVKLLNIYKKNDNKIIAKLSKLIKCT